MQIRQFCFRLPKFFLVLIMFATAWASPGDLDSSFGFFGISSDGLANHPNFYLYPADMAQQSDGSILVAGTYTPTSGSDYSLSRVLLRRYTPSGSPDVNYGVDGFAVAEKMTQGYIDISGEGKAVMVQPDGKVLVAGLVYGSSSSDTRIAVWRFTSLGKLDTTFGTDGQALVYSPTVGSAVAVGYFWGKIIVATRVVQGSETDSVLFRLNSDGTVDTSFGFGGWVLTGGQNGTTLSGLHNLGGARALAIDFSTGDILVGGHYYDTSHHLGIARYNQSGSLVTSFGTNGVAMTPTVITGNNCGLTDTSTVRYDSVMLFSDGRVAAGGYIGDLGNQFLWSYFLGRYTAAGITDVAFSSDGYTQGPCSAYSAHLSGSVLQSNGKIIHLVPVNDTANSATLYRVTTSGIYDLTWNPANRDFGAAQHLMIQTTTGKLIRQGSYLSNGKPRVMLGRYLL